MLAAVTITMKCDCGVNAFLTNSTSLPDSPTKRICVNETNNKIKNTFEVKSARGIHAALPLAKPVSRSSSLQDATATETLEPSLSVSFRYVMSHKSEVVEEGLACIQSYIERNTSFIFQKALLSSSFLPQCLRWRFSGSRKLRIGVIIRFILYS